MPDEHDQLELLQYDARREQARALRRAGGTVAEIAAYLGDASEYRIHSWVCDIPPPNVKRRVRAKDELRGRARDLRSQGWTYPEIAHELGVSKSSCSIWCRDLPPPARHPRRRHTPDWEPFRRRRALRRAEVTTRAKDEIGQLSKRELFLVGVALYWAEGTKSKPWGREDRVTFTNSDAAVIRTFEAWLDLLDVAPDDRVYDLYIHESGDATGARSFWARILGLNSESRIGVHLKRHNPKTVRKNIGAEYRGCLVIHIRQGANLYQRIEGWWSGLSTASQSTIGSMM
jgi:hypothetical protein